MASNEKFWNRIADAYEREPIKDLQKFKSSIQRIEKYLNPKSKVLDFACGTGTLSLELAAKVEYIEAIDISEKMIGHAKRKTAEKQIKNIHCQAMELFDHRLQQQKFDMLIAFNVLHLIQHSGELVERVHSLLKPKGYFISSSIYFGDEVKLSMLIMRLLGKLRLIPEINPLQQDNMHQLLLDKGFDIVESVQTAKSPKEVFIVARRKD